VTNAVEQLSCQELVELVTDYLEGVLPEEQRQRLEEHLGRCDGCGRYVQQMRATLRVTGELTPASLSPEAEEALLEAFRNWRAR
jgi:anti-sigma factor RsiW